MTPKELAAKTVRDITRKRELVAEGKKQATAHGIDNMRRVKRRIRKYE